MSAPLPTGDRMIDEEHRQLHAALARLRDTCARYDEKTSCDGCSDELISECSREYYRSLGNVIEFMVAHFSSEEALFRDSGLAAEFHELYARHVEEHANLSERLSALAADNIDNVVASLQKMSEVLVQWLDRHILDYDIPMVAGGSGGGPTASSR